MSYRNPKIYAPDPTAFAKSFQGSFMSTLENFEAEREKKRQQQEKDDLIEAELVKYQNIGDLEGVSESVNSALQQSINNLVDSKSFVEMSAVDRQKELNNIQNIKAGSAAFVDLINISPDELSNRSVQAHPELHAVLTQIKLDPSKVKITPAGTGTDVMFTYTDENGNVNSTSLRDMRKFKNTYVSATEDVKFYNTSLDSTIDGLQSKIADDARIGVGSRDKIVNSFLKNADGSYKDILDKDEKATIFYEMLGDDENLRKAIGYTLYPKNSTPEQKALQDKAIYDYYFKEIDERVTQPAVKDISSTATDTRTADQKNADDLRKQAEQVNEFMKNIPLTASSADVFGGSPGAKILFKDSKMQRPIADILSDFTKALNPKGYRINFNDGKYELEQLERVTATGIKVNKDLTDITADIKALQNNDNSKLISTILTKVYKQLPIFNN